MDLDSSLTLVSDWRNMFSSDFESKIIKVYKAILVL